MEAGRALRQIGDIHVVRGSSRTPRRLRRAPGTRKEGRDRRSPRGGTTRATSTRSWGITKRPRTFTGAPWRLPVRLRRDRNGRATAPGRSTTWVFARRSLASVAATEGNVAAAGKQYREALRLEEEALREARAGNDGWRQGYVLRALAQIHRELGELSSGADASREFAGSLARADEAIVLGKEMKEKEWEGLGLHHKGIALALLGRHEDALAAFREAIGIWEANGDLQAMGQAWQMIAHRVHEARGKDPEALEAYGKALGIFERIRAFELVAAVHLSLGALFERQGELEQAKASYLASIEALESVRSRLTSEEHKIAFFERRQGPYEALISLLARIYRKGARREVMAAPPCTPRSAPVEGPCWISCRGRAA